MNVCFPFADEPGRIRRMADDVKWWLGKPNFLHLIYRKPAAAALPHDLLAGLIGNSFGKKNRICFHRRLSI
jgi:hypothetical protein